MAKKPPLLLEDVNVSISVQSHPPSMPLGSLNRSVGPMEGREGLGGGGTRVNPLILVGRMCLRVGKLFTNFYFLLFFISPKIRLNHSNL